MKLAYAPCIVLSLLVVTRVAGADDPQCAVTSEPAYPDSSLPLVYATPRHVEFGAEVRYLGDSLPVQSSIATALVLAYVTRDHWLRLGLRAGFAAGAWGEDGRGPVAGVAGARLAVDVGRLASGLVAFHIPANLDFLFGAKNGDAIARFTVAGIGVNVGRIGSLDLMMDLSSSLGAPFSNGWALAPGLSVAFTVDFCGLGGWCSAAAQTNKEHDVTGKLYDAIRAGVAATPPLAPHDDICAAIDQAMNIDVYYPRGNIDATTAFLEGVKDNSHSASGKQWLASIIQMHKNFLEQLNQSRRDMRREMSANKAVTSSCAYSPYPMEIRAAFGCDPPPTPSSP